jgi:hypothetical protein
MAEHPKLICTLPVEQTGSRINEWGQIRAAAGSVEEVADGVALTLPASFTHQVEAVAAREAECCAFLNLVTLVDEDHIRLEITSEVAGADHVIRMLVGGPT